MAIEHELTQETAWELMFLAYEKHKQAVTDYNLVVTETDDGWEGDAEHQVVSPTRFTLPPLVRISRMRFRASVPSLAFTLSGAPSA